MSMKPVPEDVVVYFNGGESNGGTFDSYTAVFSDGHSFGISEEETNPLVTYYGRNYKPMSIDTTVNLVPDSVYEKIFDLLPV